MRVHFIQRARLFPPDHPNYAGDLGIDPNPNLADRVKKRRCAGNVRGSPFPKCHHLPIRSTGEDAHRYTAQFAGTCLAVHSSTARF